MAFRRLVKREGGEGNGSVSAKKTWSRKKLLEPESTGIETMRSLIDAAKYEEHWWDRIVAFKKLGRNIAGLTEIATDMDSLGYADTRKLAIKELSRMVNKLNNTAALICVACNSRNKKSRMAALKKLGENAIALREIINSCHYEEILGEAVERLSRMVGRLDDPGCLRLVALYSNDPKKKHDASKKLERDDVNFVIDVAEHHHDQKKRKDALKKLELNVEALREVARCGYYLDTANEAIKKLTKLSKDLLDPIILEGLPKLL